MTRKKAIIGAGGFGREVFHQMMDSNPNFEIEIFDDNQLGFRKTRDINFDEFEILIAVGNPKTREKIFKSLPKNASFFTFIHKTAQIIDKSIKIGEGSIICANSIITCDTIIGKHALINLNCTIGHDCIIGDFFSAQPSVNVSGNCKIGDFVYLGTNSSIREKINITDNVTIGLNSGVVKDILESGTYVGCPAKKIK